jgi:hypothetical protein
VLSNDVLTANCLKTNAANAETLMDKNIQVFVDDGKSGGVFAEISGELVSLRPRLGMIEVRHREGSKTVYTHLFPMTSIHMIRITESEGTEE